MRRTLSLIGNVFSINRFFGGSGVVLADFDSDFDDDFTI